MDKLRYFFKTRNLDLVFQEKVEKIGVKKDNSFGNNKIQISLYRCKNILLGVKRSGRPQYLLFSFPDMKLLENCKNQTEMIKKLPKYIQDDKIDMDKIVGLFFKHFRVIKHCTQKTLAEKLNISLSTLRKYENGGLSIPPAVLQNFMDVFNIKIDEYKNQFKCFLKENNLNLRFSDFVLHKVFQKNIDKKQITDIKNITQIMKLYKINMKLAYRYMKIANEEMRESNYIITPGKVSLKKFDEVYRRFNYGK